MAAAAGEALAAAKRNDATEKYKAGNYREAVALYSEAIEAAPSSQLYANRAAAYMMLQEYAAALEDCERAVTLDPSNIKAYVRGAKAALAAGDVERAVVLARTGALKDPRDDAARAEQTSALTAQKRLAAARSALETREWDKALSLLNVLCDSTCPGAYPLRLLRIEAQLGLRQYDAAYSASSDLLKAHSDDPRLLVLRARILAAQGNTTGATKHLQARAMAARQCTASTHAVLRRWDSDRRLQCHSCVRDLGARAHVRRRVPAPAANRRRRSAWTPTTRTRRCG
jgi:DnaJ family protein C protein 7